MRTKELVLSILALLVTVTAFAEGPGRIEGRVVDENDKGVGGVVVVLQETGIAEITNPKGMFAVSDVPAGTYTLIFTLGGNSVTNTGVEVTAGQTTAVEMKVDWDVAIAETVTVYSASRRVERIVEAPASVSVVNEDQIQRQASHGQAPKLLEFSPGAEVTQSGLYDYNFNTRGFNSSLNRRVATLIDGRNPAVPFLGAQEWAAISFPLDDLASVELIRGPSAALYGANASSGVLNMASRQPRYSQGGQLRVAGGELSTLNADLRWAHEIGAGWYFKLNAGVRDSGDFTVSRNETVEYSEPCVALGQTDCLPVEAVPLAREDDNEISFYGLRFDKYLANGSYFTIEGGNADIAGPAFQTGIGRVQLLDVERPWARLNFNSDHWNVLLDYTKRDAPEQLGLLSGENLALDTDRVHAEAQTNWDFAGDRLRLVAGGSYMEEDIDSRDPKTGEQTLMFQPVSAESWALFAQLDWQAAEKFKVVLAGRFDSSDLHRDVFNPKAALVYSPTPDHSIRLTYNEAFQVANYSEFFLQALFPIPGVENPLDLSAVEPICTAEGVDCGFGDPTESLALGNASLDIEEIETIELGYTGILNGRTFLTADYYVSDNASFITDLIPQIDAATGARTNPNFGPYAPPDELSDAGSALLVGTLQAALGPQLYPLLSNNVDGTPIFATVSYKNFGEVDAEGVDLGIKHYFANKIQVDFTYSWFDFEIKDTEAALTNQLLPNTPEHKLALGIGYNSDRWDLNLSGRWVDEFRWIVGPFQGNVESYTTVDLNGNYYIDKHWTVGFAAANVLDEEHWETFGGDINGRRALAHVVFNW
jgi:iron complex outermembrane receptor protein